MFQRCKRDLNIGFMGVVRSCRDRQLDLFAEVDQIFNGNVNILEKQVREGYGSGNKKPLSKTSVEMTAIMKG